MIDQTHPLNLLIEELKKIPSIGAKTAQRIAFYITSLPQEEADRLAKAIKDAKRNTFYCSVCNSMTHVDPCQYCTESSRNDEVLCVVEEPFNISSIEKTGIYNGRYHVLLGALSPLKGVGPDELKTEKLVKRIKEGNLKEIIIATNPTTEGEATALFIERELKPLGIRTTRLGLGLPKGGELEYADEETLSSAFEGRK